MVTFPLMRFKPRFYNRREPQETANIPRKPRRKRTDRNQNVNRPRDNRAAFRRADTNIGRPAENRSLNRISGKMLSV